MKYHSSISKFSVILTISMTSVSFSFSTNTTLSALPTNTALNLGSYAARCADSSFDPDNCRRFGDYSRFTYDPDHHQILFFGGGHATTMRDDIDVFNFDSLKWKSAYASTRCNAMTSVTTNGTWSSSGHPVARHTYDQLIYAPNVHRLIITSPVYGAGYCGTFGGCGEWCAGKMLFYDPDAKTWISKNTAANQAHVVSSEYDPVSGRIISAGGPGLSTYDPVADSKVDYLSTSPIGDYADNLVYFPPNDKFYYFTRGTPIKVYVVTLNRTTWSSSTIQEVTGMNGTPGTDETGWAYDSANRIIGGGLTNGSFYAFNPVTNAWATRTMSIQGGGSGPTGYSHCMEYDPVDKVFIFYGNDFNTWAYCYSRNSATAIRISDKIEHLRVEVTARTGQGGSRFRIETPKPISKFEVALFNAAGESLRFSQSVNGNNFAIQTDRHLRGGLYLLKISLGEKIFTTKLIIQQ